MRTLIWGLTVLMVVGAGVIYLAASHAARHPESFVGRYATAAEFVARRCNPVAVIQHLLQPSREVAPAACRQPIREEAPDQEPRLATEEPPTILIDAIEEIEPIEVSVPQPHQMVIQVEAEESLAAPEPASPEECAAAKACWPIEAAEEISNLPSRMPYAHEDMPEEVCQEGTVNDLDQKLGQAVADIVLGLGLEKEENVQEICQTMVDIFVVGGMLAMDGDLAALPCYLLYECLSQSCLGRFCQNCFESREAPGQSGTSLFEGDGLVKEFVDLTADDDGTEGSDAEFSGRYPCPDFPEASEVKNEPLWPAGRWEDALAPCREDPNYHHQYPGCPFTGRPSSPCQPPPRPQLSPPQPAEKPSQADEEFQVPAGLDTMECRPTDLEDTNDHDEPF